jgi:hypothetical protein
MKANKLIMIVFGIILLNLLTSSCKKDESTSKDKSIPSITTSEQASRVAFCISSTIGDFILDRFSDNVTWNNTTKNGYSSGTIKINGAYHHTEVQYGYNYPKETYTFESVTVTCVDLSNDNNDTYPLLTGTASVSGSIYEQHGSRNSTFSGGWTMTGHMKLSKKYNDEVSFTFYYGEDYFTSTFSGTLTTKAGTSYDIQSDFKK